MPTLRITAADMDLMIRTARPTATMTRVIERSRIDGMHLRLDMDPEEARDLQIVLAGAVTRAATRQDRRTLERLTAKLGEMLARGGEGLEIDPLDMARRILDYNMAPRYEFDGLSSAEVHGLIRFPWTADTPGLQIHDDVDPALLEGADLLHNARILLTALGLGGTKATAVSGNLNRVFVGEMLAVMRLPEGEAEMIREMNKVINEEDVWELHQIRVVLTEARLIARRKGMIVATKKGRDLAVPERAGRLLALLFETTFRKYNLAYGDRLPDVAVFQHTIAYPIAVLARLDGGWIDFEELKPRLLLPAVVEALPSSPYIDYEKRLICARLIYRLEAMGLLECRRDVKPGGVTNVVRALRKTPAYDELIGIELGSQE